MNIGAKLHERWAANAVLNGLLDSSLVVTGTYFDAEPDLSVGYATITFPNDSAGGESSDDSSIENRLVRITNYAGRDCYDEGDSISDAVKTAFHRASFALDDSDFVMAMMWQGRQTIDDDEGDWYFVNDFLCKVERAP
jgi:hypothetical protein